MLFGYYRWGTTQVQVVTAVWAKIFEKINEAKLNAKSISSANGENYSFKMFSQNYSSDANDENVPLKAAAKSVAKAKKQQQEWVCMIR